ncbi:MAG: hypothetical protein V1668_03415 [Patescibacteria group bacterium]
MEASTPTNEMDAADGKHAAEKIKSPRRRRIDCLVTIIINALLLYVANNLLVWEAQFLKHEWTDVLPAVNLTLSVTLGINILFLFYDSRGFYFISRTFSDAVSIYAAYRVWRVFPFDFHGFFELGWLNPVMKIVLPIAAVGIVIAIIVRAVRYSMNKNIYY